MILSDEVVVVCSCVPKNGVRRERPQEDRPTPQKKSEQSEKGEGLDQRRKGCLFAPLKGVTITNQNKKNSRKKTPSFSFFLVSLFVEEKTNKQRGKGNGHTRTASNNNSQ